MLHLDKRGAPAGYDTPSLCRQSVVPIPGHVALRIRHGHNMKEDHIAINDVLTQLI